MAKGSVTTGEIDLNNLRTVWKNSMKTNTEYTIEKDGYIIVRINFTNLDGYALVSILNRERVTIMTNQINCGHNLNHAYDSTMLPVKAGFRFKVTGEMVMTNTVAAKMMHYK